LELCSDKNISCISVQYFLGDTFFTKGSLCQQTERKASSCYIAEGSYNKQWGVHITGPSNVNSCKSTTTNSTNLKRTEGDSFFSSYPGDIVIWGSSTSNAQENGSDAGDSEGS